MRGRLDRAAKRTLDAVAAAAGMALLSPIMAMIAIAIRLDSPGPVFYRQTRIGRGGRPFRLWKFRSMRVGSDRVSRLTPDHDSRVTRVGRFLRSSHLDELPQLLNVLAGTMSLVGPRPEVPEFVDLADSRWQAVLSVRPGMTSPETLQFRRQGEAMARQVDYVDYYRRVIRPTKLDLQARFVAEGTFWGDLGVIARTFAAILRRGGVL